LAERLVVVLTRRPLTIDDPVAEVLAPIGANVVGCWMDDPEFAGYAARADAFVFSGGFTRDMLDRSPRCRIIARDGLGYDNVDVAAATERGIWVTIIPDALVDDVADHALMLLFGANRKLVQLDRACRAGEWRPEQAAFFANPPRKLRGAVLGLVGLGRIGRAVAERARGFGLKVLASDPFVSSDVAESAGAILVPLDDLLRAADFVSIHVPLTPATQKLIGERELRLMKASSLLINTSRGGVCDEAALVRALEAGWIRGAGLDVLEVEPVTPENPLLKMSNVVLTPHIASVSDVSNRERRAEAAREVLRVLGGERPRVSAVVNRELFARV
jgi:D-3-phosphoglycerate dehydrogenase / 2-oxoglutarate reductase